MYKRHRSIKKNRGAVLYGSPEYTPTKLDKISKISTEIDSAWDLVKVNKKRYIIGSVYVKINYKTAINEVNNMLNEACITMIKMKASGLVLLGDFNARHITWGYNKNDSYGNALVDQFDYVRFYICSDKNPTFLLAKGSSVIDFAMVSNNLTEKIISTDTDNEVELFPGAPRIGHIPIMLKLSKDNVSNPATKSKFITKLSIDKMNWRNWTSQ